MPNDYDRRDFLATTAAAASLALLPAALRAAAGASAQWTGYRDAIVIDALGGPGRDMDVPTRPPLDASELAGIRNSGITALNFTIGSVGSYANDYNETIRNIAYWDREIAAHPELLMKITRGDRIEEAKRAG